MKNKIKFCWLCGKRLQGISFEKLTVDEYPRIFHKACAKYIEKSCDFIQKGKQYFSIDWREKDKEWS